MLPKGAITLEPLGTGRVFLCCVLGVSTCLPCVLKSERALGCRIVLKRVNKRATHADGLRKVIY